MSVDHDFHVPTGARLDRKGRKGRRCRHCHIGEDHAPSDICPVLAARSSTQQALADIDIVLEEQSVRTPYTARGLRQFDHLPPDEALAAAWANPGPNGEWHAAAQKQLRDAMPLVHRAILRIIDGVNEQEQL